MQTISFGTHISPFVSSLSGEMLVGLFRCLPTWEQDKSSKHFFSLNFPLICSQICLRLLNAFLLKPFLVKPHYNFVFTWTNEGSLQHLCVELAPNLQRTSQTGVNHIITDRTACRIMPWEQCWQFLNCEITQAELGMHCVWCGVRSKTTESASEALKGL